MPRIDDLSDAEFMKLQAEYGDSLPICPICTLEDVRHLLLELVVGDAVSDEVKSALAPVLYAARWRSREMALRISVAMRTTMMTGRLHGRRSTPRARSFANASRSFVLVRRRSRRIRPRDALRLQCPNRNCRDRQRLAGFPQNRQREAR